MSESLAFSRRVKRYAFPLIVIAVTILAVALILDRRNREGRPQIITPAR